MTPARADLPHGLRLLIEAAGEQAALSIALARGGSRLTIPMRAEGTVLEELVGIDAARAIVDSLGGAEIKIPQAKRPLSEHLKAQGWSQERRAVRLKVSRTTIQNWDRAETKPPQPDLFNR